MGEPDQVGIVASEFATVSLSIDNAGNGTRLRIEDLRTGHVGYLDALELETLAWLPDGALHPLLRSVAPPLARAPSLIVRTVCPRRRRGR